MARGSKYTDEQREQALAMLIEKSVKEVSKILNIPERTLKDWQDKPEKINPNFVELRNEKKKEFVEIAWSNISKANTLLGKKLDKAILLEDKIENIINKILKSNKEMSATEINDFRRALSSMRIENVSQLSTLIGTLYDKQALSDNKPTSIVELKLEDFFDEPNE